MTKKINCKDGLDKNEEIQARRARIKLENGDEELLKEVKTLYAEWYKKPRKSFFDWLADNDRKVLSSALKRMDDWSVILV